MIREKPLVSCIIPTHNRADILTRAVTSVLAQTHGRMEIIIIDDGSNDATQKIVRGLMREHDAIRYLRHETARGASASRNAGILAASGEFVAFLDDDDIWLPEYVESMLATFSDDCAFVYADTYRCKGSRTRRVRRPAMITREDMLRRPTQGTVLLFTRRDYLLDVGGFDESLPCSEDNDLWLRLLALKPVARGAGIPLVVVNATDRVGRISVDRRKTFVGRLRVYRKHKGLMNRALRQERLYAIRKILHPYPSLKRILWMVPQQNLARELRRFVKNALLRPFRKG